MLRQTLTGGHNGCMVTSGAQVPMNKFGNLSDHNNDINVGGRDSGLEEKHPLKLVETCKT